MVAYITDIHALNLPSDTDTTGDWHRYAIQWVNPRIGETDSSPFGSWGVIMKSPIEIPEHAGKRFNIANHVRACLDIIAARRFTVAQGMRRIYIANDFYDQQIFQKILLLRNNPNWDAINQFMRKEYALDWVRFLESKEQNDYRL